MTEVLCGYEVQMNLYFFCFWVKVYF